MKIACIADMHGHLPEEIPECDVLVIAGDICPATDHSFEFQRDWLYEEFTTWLYSNCINTTVVMVAGNHDWAFELSSVVGRELDDFDGRKHYLQDNGLAIRGTHFYGHPWTPNFCNWAFNSGTTALRLHNERIPEGTDVLVTHGPPHRILDVPGGQSEHCGCKYLRGEVQERVKPKLHVFGHIHGSYGKTVIDGTTYVNASYVDELYTPRGPDSIQVVEIS